MDFKPFLDRYIQDVPQLRYPWQYLEFLRGDWQPRCNWLSVKGSQQGMEYRMSGETPTKQPYVVITGDVVFGRNIRIGPFSFLRGPLVIGDNVMIGPHVELARSIVMDGAKISHKNIVVDSMIGEKAHLAGFTTTCNKCTGREFVNATYYGESREVYAKYGCCIGHEAQLGAGIYLMPGACVYEKSAIPGPAVIYGLEKVRQVTTLAGQTVDTVAEEPT